MTLAPPQHMPQATQVHAELPAIDKWRGIPIKERIRRVCALRHLLASNPQPFIDAIQMPFRRSAAETLAAEIVPLADACKFVERNAARLLRPIRLGFRGRPLWLWGTRSEIHREPLGRVLIIAPGNYPLMLSGIQIIQALVAGNGVVLKPAPGTRAVALLLARALRTCGVPDSALVVLEESPDAAKIYYNEIDKIIMTGSVASGRAVVRDLAEFMKPAVMELSGCDAAIVLPGANLALTAACIRFGLSFNGSNSCIAPRRLLVHDSIADALIAELGNAISTVPLLPLWPHVRAQIDKLVGDAIAGGAKLVSGVWPAREAMSPLLFDRATACMRLQHEDIGAPIASILRIITLADIHAASAFCPFRLGASIFGPVKQACELAETLNVGSVVINDLIAPTADPRLPFGGAGASGFGSTRGAEGLLEMTRPKTIQICRGSPRFHLQMESSATASLLRAQLQMSHAARWSQRIAGLRNLISLARASRRGKKS